MSERPSITNILNEGGGDWRQAWNQTEAAADFEPIPAGTYTAIAQGGELIESRHGTPGYRLRFRIRSGEFAGRVLVHDLWLSPAALPMTKRDLAKLGISGPEDLERPLEPGLVCEIRVARRVGDDGEVHNAVKRFELIRRAAAPADDGDFPPGLTAGEEGGGNG